MSFSDKLSANLTNAGRTVSQMARNFTDTNALQREMSAEKRNIQQRYAEIGQLYYEICKDNPDADFREAVESITASFRRIEEIQEEIQGVQARKPELVPVPPKNVKPSAMVCMKCGCTYDVSQEFCAQCGQKLTAQYPTPAAAAQAPAQPASDVQTQPPLTPQPEDAFPQEIPVVPANFCPKCGMKAANDSLFCAQCGNKLG